MYDIIETHIDVETGVKSEELVHCGDRLLPYHRYEDVQKDIENFLVPHSVELGKLGDEIDYNDGVSVYYNDGIPTKWTVLRKKYYHTEYAIRIRRAGS